MAKNLVAKNGTVVHAPAATDRNPVLCSNMRRQAGYEIIEAGFSYTDAPVSCKNCCKKLGKAVPAAGTVRRPAKKVRVVVETTQADIEASRVGAIEWAEFEVKCDGGMVMDTLHGLAITMDGWRRPARRR